MTPARTLGRRDPGERGALRGTLPVSGPLDLEATLVGGQAFRWSQRGGWWWGFVASDLVRLRWAGRGGRALVFESAGGAADAAALVRYFRLDEAWEARVASLAGDPLLAPVAQRFPGLRLLRQDPWETLVSFIVSANSNIPKISRTLEALATRVGRRIELAGHPASLFPEPEALARLTLDELRETSMGYRAGFVRAVARLVADGVFDPDVLPGLPPREARERLLGLPGVGEKVADCVLLFTGAHDGAFPVDVWVQRAVERLAFRGRAATPRKIREWAEERWGANAGLAQQWLFHDARRAAKGPSGEPSPAIPR